MRARRWSLRRISRGPRAGRFHRVRINPYRRNGSLFGGGGLVGGIVATLKEFGISFLVGIAAQKLDELMAKNPAFQKIPSQFAKAAAAVAVGFLGRRFGGRGRDIAGKAIVALGALQGYSWATERSGGAAAAQTPADAIKGLGNMAESYPEMGALLQGGVGALLQGMGDYGPMNSQDIVTNYSSALQGMGDDE